MNKEELKEKLFELFETAKQSKKNFSKLKNLAVSCQDYELAAFLRGVETDVFKQTEQQKQETEEAKRLKTLFSMVGFNINNPDSWLLAKSLESYKNNGGTFSISDADELKKTAAELFFDEQP